jgi:aryl-alcohol dehydrogenase-like predicted oxidoreductase
VKDDVNRIENKEMSNERVAYRQLGRTGLQVSSLAVGCMMFGWKIQQAEAARIVDKAIDSGLNLFDTSSSYGCGESERVLGQALAQNGKRSQILLATKAHFRSDENDINAFGNSRRHLIQQCNESLKRLRTDYIDLFQVHRPQPSIPIDETLRALDDLVRSGKVRYIGSSAFAAWQVLESIWVAKEYCLNRFTTEQPPYNILDRQAERELFPMAQTYGLGLLTYSPLAEGILTGKYKKNEPLPAGSRFAQVTKPGLYAKRLTTEVYAVVQTIEDLAHQRRCTMSQFSLAWILQQPAISAVIIGPSTIEQLIDNLGAFDTSLSNEELDCIDAVAPPESAVSSYHDADWGPASYRW